MRLSTFGFVCAVGLFGATTGCVVKVRSNPNTPPPAQPAATPAVTEAAPPARRLRTFKLPEIKDNRVQLPGPVMFNDNQATLKPESDAILELVYEYLKQTPKVTKHRVEGHTDTVGDDAKNKLLSQARALAVAKWLVAKGIDCNRLVAVGFGESRPKVSPEKTDDDKATNRRVEFVNAEIDGKPIAGLPVDGGGEIVPGVCN